MKPLRLRICTMVSAMTFSSSTPRMRGAGLCVSALSPVEAEESERLFEALLLKRNGFITGVLTQGTTQRGEWMRGSGEHKSSQLLLEVAMKDKRSCRISLLEEMRGRSIENVAIGYFGWKKNAKDGSSGRLR